MSNVRLDVEKCFASMHPGPLCRSLGWYVQRSAEPGWFLLCVTVCACAICREAWKILEEVQATFLIVVSENFDHETR
jgi:hypothetical protein